MDSAWFDGFGLIRDCAVWKIVSKKSSKRLRLLYVSGVQGLGFMLLGLGLRFMVQGVGFRVYSLGL